MDIHQSANRTSLGSLAKRLNRPYTLKEISKGYGQLDDMPIDRRQRPTAKSRSLFNALMSMNGANLKH